MNGVVISLDILCSVLCGPDVLAFAGNHMNIFNDAGVPWKHYRYFDPKTVGLDFEGMTADIEVNYFGK